MKSLQTATEIINELGGPTKFAQWWGCNRVTATMWKARGFPAKTFYLMIERLRREHKISADPSAWNQKT